MAQWWRWPAHAARTTHREPTGCMGRVVLWREAPWRKTLRSLRRRVVDEAPIRLQRGHSWGDAGGTICRCMLKTRPAPRFRPRLCLVGCTRSALRGASHTKTARPYTVGQATEYKCADLHAVSDYGCFRLHVTVHSKGRPQAQNSLPSQRSSSSFVVSLW